MRDRRGFYGILTAVVMTGVGCTQDLGVCDMDVAKQVYFDEGSGVALYAGQALMVRDCTSCHQSGAPGTTRRGAPADLDFDVSPATSPEHVDRLARDWRRTQEMRDAVFFETEKGFMPPPSSKPFGRFSDANGNALPPISSSEGIDMLKAWLACGAPIVGESQAPSTATTPGQVCSSSAAIGDCLVGTESRAAANWQSIYENTLEPSCVSCHNSSTPSAGLDFATMDGAYSALLGDGSGALASRPGTLSCERDPMRLVEPFDPERSVLWLSVEKAASSRPECVLAMPLGAPLSSPQRDAIRDWISNGAPMN